MRLLLFGGSGQVGQEFRSLALPQDVELVAPNRDQLNLDDSRAIARIIGEESWSAVINAAAYTDVDRAESQESSAFAVNAEAPSRLAAETGCRGIPLIHISTDYVFDGRKGAPYVEGDTVAPINVYGRTKLAGEHAVRAANPQHIIMRTSWVYSPFRENFVKTILRLAKERDRLPVVADQRGCPTAARDVARACLEIAMRCALGPQQVAHGIYHFAGAGEATWFELASAVVEVATDRLGRSPQIVPIRTSEYPTPAVRAADTRLDCAAIMREFGVQPLPWRQALTETIDRLLISKDVS
jgi:dTDP-4-dehydrorhamnose reductase